MKPITFEIPDDADPEKFVLLNPQQAQDFLWSINPRLYQLELFTGQYICFAARYVTVNTRHESYYETSG
jgi:hypothetical protein